MKITIGGIPGAGKSTIGKMLAEKLDHEFLSIGKIRRKLAQERGLTIDEYNSLPEDTDTPVDDYQRRLGKEGDNFVIEGRLAFHFIPDSIKLYFECSPRDAAERIFRDKRDSEKDVDSADQIEKAIISRMISDRERYKKHYGLDCYNPGLFDHVIDTTGRNIEEVLEEAIGICQRYK